MEKDIERVLISAQELEAFYLRPPQADPLKKKPAPMQ